MIAACYVVCNEEALIAESIRSVKEYVDRIVVLDVVFASNPLDATHSTDRTREIVEAVAAPVPLTYSAETEKLTEVTARNGVLTFLTQRDWALVLDGDETLVGDHDSIKELLAWIRSGKLEGARGLQVYTERIIFDGHAPAMSPEEYATLPVVSSVGIQPRLFPVRGHQYQEAEGAPGLYHNGSWVGTGALVTECHLVNHRTRRSFEGYQAAYRWETG